MANDDDDDSLHEVKPESSMTDFEIQFHSQVAFNEKNDFIDCCYSDEWMSEGM